MIKEMQHHSVHVFLRFIEQRSILHSHRVLNISFYSVAIWFALVVLAFPRYFVVARNETMQSVTADAGICFCYIAFVTIGFTLCAASVKDFLYT